MKRKSRQHYEAQAAVAKALGHPTRLVMPDALAGGELCVCDLTKLVGADQSTVSKHLAVLKQAGTVADRKLGSQTFYSLKICCFGSFWDCVESVPKDNVKEQQAALR